MRLALLAVTDDSTPTRRAVQRMCPPLGILYLQSYLQAQDPTLQVHCGYDLAPALASAPDLIGLSSVTENFGRTCALAQQLKQQTGLPLLVGGPHISLLPHSLPDCFDLGVVGEGEHTLQQLVELFGRRGRFEPAELEQVPGIVFHHPQRGVVQTPRRAPIEDLDSLPFPRRPTPDPAEVTHLITSRGCPCDCVFCSSPTLWNGWRMHSAGHVVEELAWIHANVATGSVKFFDDLFIASPGRVREIAAGMQQRGVRFRDGCGAFARANLIRPALMPALEQMDLNFLYIGIESGSPRMLERLGKNSSVEINQRALDLCQQHGLRTCCSFVIGVPGETGEDLDATLAFIDRNQGRISEVEICPAVPFPGTPLWDQALQRGLVAMDMDWTRLRDHSDFAEFELDDYLYLNPAMPRAQFERYVLRFKRLYRLLSAARLHTLARLTDDEPAR